MRDRDVWLLWSRAFLLSWLAPYAASPRTTSAPDEPTVARVCLARGNRGAGKPGCEEEERGGVANRLAMRRPSIIIDHRHNHPFVNPARRSPVTRYGQARINRQSRPDR